MFGVALFHRDTELSVTLAAPFSSELELCWMIELVASFNVGIFENTPFIFIAFGVRLLRQRDFALCRFALPLPPRGLATEDSFQAFANCDENDSDEILDHLHHPSRWSPESLLRIFTDFSRAADEA